MRNYWIYGMEMSAGWGGWAKAAGSSAFGRILSFDDQRIYGYGRERIASGATGHKADNYRLFASSQGRAAKPLRTAPRRSQRPRARRRNPPNPPGRRTREILGPETSPSSVRAMVLDARLARHRRPAGRRPASPPACSPTKTKRKPSPHSGRKKAGLARRCPPRTAAQLSEVELDAVPVFDGMSAAGGNIYLSLKNGSIQCWK